jgi:hypothetical protein
MALRAQRRELNTGGQIYNTPRESGRNAEVIRSSFGKMSAFCC